MKIPQLTLSVSCSIGITIRGQTLKNPKVLVSIMAPSTIRSFIAIDIPNPETIQQILDYQRQVQAILGPLKLVKPELMHITLHFLGDIEEEVAKKLFFYIKGQINEQLFAGGKTYEASFQGVGDFRRNVFFIKLKDPSEIIARAHGLIQQELEGYPSIRLDRRPFKPHLTIARAKRGHQQRNKEAEKSLTAQYQKLKNRYQDLVFGPWTIAGVHLKKSVLTPKGPIYSNLQY
jgi:RNA 2',3'-cyclic 3'-phosphodiesterase